MDLKSKIILIYGPTASGKSKFAITLAKKINGEIINADSMQVYKELKILSARPSRKDIKKIRHHLYGFQNVKKKFSTGHWLKLVDGKILEIKKRKKIPILVGGTGLYFKALTDGLVKIPNIPVSFRKKIIDYQKKVGQKKFYKQLIKIDPKSKSKINPKDAQRSIRAFEVKKLSKISLFDWFDKTKSSFKKDQFQKIYLDFPRDILLKRIEKRCIKIVNTASIKEVARFKKMKVRNELSANKIIGINEINNYLQKNYNLDQTREKILIKTRQYAKRQATWARGHMSDWKRLTPNEIKNYIKNFK